MARALLAAVFGVVMCVLAVLPGSGHDGSAPTAADRRTATAETPDPSVTEPSSPASSAPTSATTSAPSTDPEPTTQPPQTTPPDQDCTPDVPLVDGDATPEAVCLAATLDDWRTSGRYGLGQQLNVSNADYLAPLDELQPERPAVVGFDLDELALGETYDFATPPLQSLLELNEEGVVLTASWHTLNPGTGGDSYDKGWQDLGALLSPGNAAYDAFWRDVDAKIELLQRLQTGDDGRFAPAAVVFRPLHEANGDWFWWAQGTDPSTYRKLYAAIQQRAAEAGVHNVVWGWSANAVNDDRITDPLTILPDRVDLVGVDSYEEMADKTSQADRLDLSGLAQLAGRVPRAAVTEAGPHGSSSGAWDPARVAPSAAADGVSPAYVMMWFDDGDGSDGSTGKKQLGSLRGGPELLSTCPDGVCSTS
ncbi:glycosyl hydrolase [Nocardioides plantarum]|uniref:Glycosyl hydrolase n=1 Tax=Nocardioides plantarum TaxID=29299 RepID=A0ABV5K682_9ACTN|nr:glycosyl hydrolase [Nocardioides plantarum]